MANETTEVLKLIASEDMPGIAMVALFGKFDQNLLLSGNQAPSNAVLVVQKWTFGAESGVFQSTGAGPQAASLYTISKFSLRVIASKSTAGVAPYQCDSLLSGKLEAHEKATASVLETKKLLENNESMISKAKNESDAMQYKTKQSQLTKRLEELDVERKRRLYDLEKKLIISFQANRFDGLIAHWTTHYNSWPTTKAIASGERLNPNVVKSLLFQETKLGLGGANTVLPSEYDWNSSSLKPFAGRYNLGQTQVSYLEIVPMMMRESEDSNVRKLASIYEKTRDEQVLVSYLTAQDSDIPKQPLVYLGRSQSAVRVFSFSFHIQCAVRWLFVKYEQVSNGLKGSPEKWEKIVAKEGGKWKTAVRMYNGSGSAAEKYRDEVYERVTRAATGKVVISTSDIS